MVKFTKNQEKAINLEGKNILINAGAGSGKTAVLTQRIIRKISQGTNLDELLVLTFTNAAAQEMKERIQSEILKKNELKEQLNYIESADITTFDGFFFKVIKKFGYKLDISRNVKIAEEMELDYYLEKVINNKFEELYTSKNKKFYKFLDYTTIENDNLVKEEIKTVYKSYINILDFQKTNKEELFREYRNYIFNLLKNLTNQINELKYIVVSDKTLLKSKQKFIDAYQIFERISNYDMLIDVMKDFKSISPTTSKKEGSKDLKEIQTKIKKSFDELKKYLILKTPKKQLEIEKNKPKEFLLDLLNDIDKNFLKIKKEKAILGFPDITRFSIELLKDKEVLMYFKNTYKEILIDEYQDTNDFQNKFIELIQNKNLYLVGDVKQSIYGFRNTNPENFEKLTKEFNSRIDCEVINLLDNFRSRDEVLKGVNYIFDDIMTEKIGGVNYKNKHKLNYGNKSYDLKGQQNYNFSVYKYEKELYKLEAKEKKEIEAHIIAQDIKEKIEQGYLIKNGDKLTPCKYSDFVILSLKKNNYHNYLKVFEEYKIPLQAQNPIKLNNTNNYEIVVLKNILQVLRLNEKSNKYKHALVSVLRSYLCEINDEEIYNYIKNGEKSSKIKEYQGKIEKIKPHRFGSISYLIDEIMIEFNIIAKMNLIPNNEGVLYRIEKILEIAQNFDSNFNKLEEFIEFLDKALTSENQKMELEFNFEKTNSVKIMTIHKSKGLEFNIVYLPELDSGINKIKKDKMDINKDLGIIFKDKEHYSYEDGFMNKLLNIKEYEEDISEKVRLMYVAMTRAKEKIIFILKEIDHDKKFGFFFNQIFLENIKYIMELNKIHDEKKTNEKIKIISNKKFVYEKNKNKKDIKMKVRASKSINHILTEKEKKDIALGNKLHEQLEQVNFLEYMKEPNIYLTKNNFEEIKIYLSNLSKYNIFKNLINYYTEYEFIDEKTHGIIDLVLEKKDELIIVDYKLANIDDKDYEKQLRIYKGVMEQYFNKKISCFVYSLRNDVLREVEC